MPRCQGARSQLLPARARGRWAPSSTASQCTMRRRGRWRPGKSGKDLAAAPRGRETGGRRFRVAEGTYSLRRRDSNDGPPAMAGTSMRTIFPSTRANFASEWPSSSIEGIFFPFFIAIVPRPYQHLAPSNRFRLLGRYDASRRLHGRKRGEWSRRAADAFPRTSQPRGGGGAAAKAGGRRCSRRLCALATAPSGIRCLTTAQHSPLPQCGHVIQTRASGHRPLRGPASRQMSRRLRAPRAAASGLSTRSIRSWGT